MININLIAERRLRKLREMTILRWASLGVFLVLLVMVTLNIMELMQVSAERAEYQQDERIVKELRQQQSEMRVVENQIREDQPKVLLLKQVRLSEGAWMTIYADLARIVPADVVLTGITANTSADGVVLRLAGRAIDEETVGTFMQALRQQTEWAKLPQLGQISMAEDPLLGRSFAQFDMSVPVRGLLGGDL